MTLFPPEEGFGEPWFPVWKAQEALALSQGGAFLHWLVLEWVAATDR